MQAPAVERRGLLKDEPLGATISGFVVSPEGVGMQIRAHARSFQRDAALVGVPALAACGLLSAGGMNRVTRCFLPRAPRA